MKHETPKNWGAMEVTALGWQAWMTRDKRLSFTCVTTSNLVVLRQRMYTYVEGTLKLGSAAPLGWGVADSLSKPSPHMCYHVKFGSSATKGVCINRKELQTWGALGSAYPTCVILPSLVVLSQAVRALLRRSRSA